MDTSTSTVTVLANHLLQSTAFAGAIWLVNLMLRNNPARVRHAMWMVASVKFLIPFVLLTAFGSHIALPVGSAPVARHMTVAAFGFSQPFAPAARTEVAHRVVALSHNRASLMAVPMLALWLAGFTTVLMGCVLRWRRVAAALRSAERLEAGREVEALLAARKTMGIQSDIEVRSSKSSLEPGVFGILRPVLMLPARLAESLCGAQLEAVAAHELCHVARRDNLMAVVHMAVEAIFWFHPLVWWIGSRLVEERERACDEEVVNLRGDPEIYAEAILNVCKIYMQSPLTCVAGVTGSNLRKRIEEIMAHRIAYKVNFGKKLLLGAAGAAAAAAPILVGIVKAPEVHAQPPSEGLAFEVASVKPNNSTDFRNNTLQFLPGGRFVARNIPLLMIVAEAYNTPFQSPRLTGGPDWKRLAFDRYDIEAAAEKGAIPAGSSTKARDDKMRLMLQSLLEERFKLKIHREPKEQLVYALVVAKSGSKLQKAKMQEKDCAAGPTGFGVGCHSIQGGIGRGIHGDAIDLADVALMVQNWTDRPVVDKTGLTDLYNIQTEGWMPMRQRPPGPEDAPKGGDAGLYDPDRQTLYKVFEQLGLRMESQRAVVDMFVVEHVEKPGEN
jgi:uncharacterized protein (TIGR03435 family)